MIPMETYATFEQRPHGLLEIVFPQFVHTFGTVLPPRVNWPILRDFLSPMLPVGIQLDHVEFWLNDNLLTEALVDCWNGFFAHATVTIQAMPGSFFQPVPEVWAPLLHLEWQGLPQNTGLHMVCLWSIAPLSKRLEK